MIGTRLSEMGISKSVLMIAFWIALAIFTRFLHLPPNFSFVGGAALFAGAMLPGPLAFVVPVAIMFGSDLVLGFHTQMPMVYASFLLVVGLGRFIRLFEMRSSVLAVGGASVFGSFLFFMISNFGVWAEGLLYPRSWSGLVECYFAGLPFLKNSMSGDLVSTAIIFLGFHLVQSTMLTRVEKN